MNTKIMKLDLSRMSEKDLEEAGSMLRAGGLVAFPTETVYGLGGDAWNSDASAKIYEAKGRPSDNPLIVHIAHRDDLQELVTEIPEKALQLAEAFWPGPLTMILHKSKKVPSATTGGLDTVAVRMPNHPIALALIRSAGVPIAAPSANTSGRPSPTLAKHVIEDLKGRIDIILDGGAVGIGLESTIIDLTCEPPMILRPGYITRFMLEQVIGEVVTDKVVMMKALDIDVQPKAPGMKYRHYAPKGNLIIFEGIETKVIDEINRRASIHDAAEVGIISTEESKGRYTNGIIKSVGTRKDEDTIAHELYRVLRELDEVGVKYIYSESFSSDDLGQAIMNRLVKAANYQIVHVG